MAGVISCDRFRSWPEVLANAARAAGGLRALGVAEDDSVALMLRNDFATFEVNMAAGQLGAYAVPINWHFTPEEAGYILADSHAKVLVIHADLLAQIASGIPVDMKVLVVPTPPEIGVDYQRLGAAVLQNVVRLLRRGMPVDRHRVGAELSGRQVGLEGREVVAQHQRHAFVLADAEASEAAGGAGSVGQDVGPSAEAIARGNACHRLCRFAAFAAPFRMVFL